MIWATGSKDSCNAQQCSWLAGKPPLEVTGAELLLNLLQKLLCWVPVVLSVGYSINSEASGVTAVCTMSCQKTGLCKLRWEAAIFYTTTCNKVQGRHLLQNFHRRLAHLFALSHCSSVPLSGLSTARLWEMPTAGSQNSPSGTSKGHWAGEGESISSLLWTTSACCWLPCPCNSFAEDVLANTGTVIHLGSIFHLNVLQTFVYCN